MTLWARLHALEKAVEEADFSLDRCDACGAPDPRGGQLIVLDLDQELARCGTCDAPLDEEHRPLGPRFKVLVLPGGAAALRAPGPGL